MLFIFGAGYQTHTNRAYLKARYCFHCNNSARWILSKTTTLISLFFIPVIPYKNEYAEYCPVCKQGKKLSRSEYENNLNQTQ